MGVGNVVCMHAYIYKVLGVFLYPNFNVMGKLRVLKSLICKGCTNTQCFCFHVSISTPFPSERGHGKLVYTKGTRMYSIKGKYSFTRE